MGAGRRLADGAAAAAAAGARRQVSAVLAENARQRPSGDCGVASRAAGGQRPVDGPCRRRAGSGGQAGGGGARRGAARSGDDVEDRRADSARHRFDRRRDRRGLRHRVHLRAGDRHEGQPHGRPGHGVRHRQEPGVRAPGDRAAAQADAVDAHRQLRRSRVSRRRRVRAARLRCAPLRTARLRHARIARGDHPQRSGRLSPGLVRRQQRDPRGGRRCHRRRGVRRGGTRLRHLAQGHQLRGARRGAPGPGPPAGHHRPARRGPDRDSRRAHGPAAQASRLSRARPRHQDPRRRGRQPPAPRAAIGSRPDLRRVGGPERA